MHERQAQIILLVRAFEEVDPDGLVLPHRERNKATRRALVVTGLAGERGRSRTSWQKRSGEAVMRRARPLYDALRRSHPAMPRILRVAQFGTSTAPVLLGAAFVFGLLLNALDLRGEIHLFYVPVLALLAWNLAILAVQPLIVLVRGRRGSGAIGLVVAALYRAAVRRRLRAARIREDHASPPARIVHKAVMRFAASWHRLAGGLLASRARRLLHLAAMASMGGALLGLQLRATSFEQGAGWNAAWLDVATMQTLIGAILGPAAALFGWRVPDVGPLAGSSNGDPTIWVQLYAASALLFVFAPRTGLVLVESWRAWRLRRSLDVDLEDGYFRRMFSAWRGATREVEIVAYGFTPGAAAMATLRTLLFDFFGALADVHVCPSVAGPDPEPLLAPAESGRAPTRETCRVVVFQTAMAPVAEVVGQWLRTLLLGLDARHDQLLLVLDASQRRARGPLVTRAEDHSEAWRSLLREVGFRALRIDRGGTPGTARVTLDERGGADAMEALRAALWPAGSADGS